MLTKHLILFCLILYNIKSITSANCNYNDGQVSIFSFPINGYICELSLENINELELMTKLNGVHNTNKANNDVKILKKSSSMELTNFMFTFCEMFNNLESIDMSGVEIEEIDADSLKYCSKLRQMSFEKNNIREIPVDLLKQSPKLTHLTFASNQLTSLSENLFNNQKKLEHLDLSYNKIKSLPGNIFKPLTRLKVLLLNKNKVATLDPNLFIKLRDLQRLNLNNNRLTDLPKGIFKNLNFLENLKLKANFLTTIHSDAFGDQDELTTVDISFNKLNSIDEELIQNSRISSIDVQGNICSQEFLQHRTEIREKLNLCFSNYKARKSQDCGKIKVGRQNIIGGSKLSQPGLSPWTALITLKPEEQFDCGGTLISSTRVISTAHCIQDKSSKTRRKPNEISILLGVYDFDDKLESARIVSDIDEIIIHPDWNIFTESFHADLSILKLASEVQFTAYIQPICLIKPDSALIRISSGIFVGYGRSEDTSKIHENIPKIIETPIHTNSKCFSTSYELVKLSSERTFCAGREDGTGVCRGDSGFGLTVKDKNTFYLRGILSSSLIDGQYACAVISYAIYTDIPKYYDWIKINSD